MAPAITPALIGFLGSLSCHSPAGVELGEGELPVGVGGPRVGIDGRVGVDKLSDVVTSVELESSLLEVVLAGNSRKSVR